MNSKMFAASAALTLTALAITGCTPNNPTNSEDGKISVSSTENECKVLATETKAGPTTFTIKNDGTQVTEFYVLGEDGKRVVSEAENIGPGISRDLTVNLAEGKYKTSCKPGMVGDGIVGDFTVKANAEAGKVSENEQQQRDQAVADYSSYVKKEAGELKSATDEFAAAYAAGDDARAKELYAPARIHFERIEPVASSFGDLDPQLDAREADLEQGQQWTGWHKIEKDLWQPTAEHNDGKKYTPLTQSERQKVAEKLTGDTEALVQKIGDTKLTVDQITNGSKSLLDEVAASKVTGEEEIWSHTDLSDFQGNVDGAHKAYEAVKPIVQSKDPELVKSLDKKFAHVQELLNKHKQGETFVSYEKLSKDEIRELSDSIDALSEPLSQLTGAVLG